MSIYARLYAIIAKGYYGFNNQRKYDIELF